MTSTLIINLMSSIDIGDANQKYLEAVKSEYLQIHNNNVTVILVLLHYDLSLGKNKLIILQKTGNDFKDFPFTPKNDDLGSPETLTQIFNKIKTEFPANFDNRILVCWGHAMGYSMFFKIIPGDQNYVLKKFSSENFSMFKEKVIQNSTIKKTLSSPNFMNNFTPDFISLLQDRPVALPIVTALTINELLDAINGAKLSFDLVVFDNCFMQNVDTFYTLKDITKFIIAPQTAIPWGGFDYAYFQHINGKIDDQFCAAFCKNSFNTLQTLDHINVNDPINDFTSSQVTFSFINTAFAKDFFDSLSVIINFYRNNFFKRGTGIADAIYRAVNESTDITKSAFTDGKGLCLIDLKYFLNKYNDHIELIYNDFDPSCKKLLSLFEQNFTKIFSGSDNSDEANGISIYFPRNKQEFITSPYNELYIKDGAQVASGFSRNTGWGIFLNAYFNKIVPQ